MSFGLSIISNLFPIVGGDKNIYPKDIGFNKRYLYRGGIAVVAVEVGCFAGSYLFWRQLNTNQDLRFYMYKNHNWLLESYYKFGEQLSGNSNIREFDLVKWRDDGKI